MIEALASNRSNHSLSMGSLLREHSADRTSLRERLAGMLFLWALCVSAFFAVTIDGL